MGAIGTEAIDTRAIRSEAIDAGTVEANPGCGRPSDEHQGSRCNHKRAHMPHSVFLREPTNLDGLQCQAAVVSAVSALTGALRKIADVASPRASVQPLDPAIQ